MVRSAHTGSYNVGQARTQLLNGGGGGVVDVVSANVNPIVTNIFNTTKKCIKILPHTYNHKIVRYLPIRIQ